MEKNEEQDHLRQENQALREANQSLRESVLESIQALKHLQERMKALEAVITSQQERIKTLEGQLAKDSHNSNLPPSSDRFVRLPKSLRQPSKKKAGGQIGHRGHHLRQVEIPDEVLLHPVLRCSHCQYDLSAQLAELPERRQVIDLPPKRLWVREHQVEEKHCPVCAHRTRASFPIEVGAPIQYGTSIQSLAVYLVACQSLLYARASQLLQEMLGVQLSGGSIASFVKSCHEQLATVETQLKAALAKVAVLNQDETSLRVETAGWWVHVCSTEHLTHYSAHRSRGRPALDAIGIAPQFRGTSVHDGFQSYQGYAFIQALCNVHHLRELTFVEEELKQDWARQMKDLLLSMKAAVAQARNQGKRELDVLLLAPFLIRYDDLLVQGYQANPPPGAPKKSEAGKRLPGRTKQSPARNLLDRFSQRKWEVLRFLHDFTVPFDNNQAERDLRMVKVQQKVSGCFRTEKGVAMFCRIRSYLSTLRKQGINLLAALERALAGHPVLPAYS